MRVLCGLGALVFLYLAVIPSGLIYSTLDSACAGPGCEVSTVSQILLIVLYGACALALLGTALVFTDYALRARPGAERRIGRALRLAALVIGIALFLMFSAAYPLGGAIATGLAAITWGWIWIVDRDRDRGGGPDHGAATNGHDANGHRALREGRL